MCIPFPDSGRQSALPEIVDAKQFVRAYRKPQIQKYYEINLYNSVEIKNASHSLYPKGGILREMGKVFLPHFFVCEYYFGLLFFSYFFTFFALS